jgi:preprotein translocase subunit SecB
METIQSMITFNGYTVDQLSFEPKTPVKTTDDSMEPSFIPDFSREIKGNEEGDCKLSLTVVIGQPDDTMPFRAIVSITGDYHVPDPKRAKEIMEINGTAILFPYLRAVVTQLTAAANLPPVYLPTINLFEMFKAQENKNIVEENSTEDAQEQKIDK